MRVLKLELDSTRTTEKIKYLRRFDSPSQMTKSACSSKATVLANAFTGFADNKKSQQNWNYLKDASLN